MSEAVSAAVSAADQLEETSATYEQLFDIEREFEHVEVDIIRQQYNATRSLYAKRNKVTNRIPNFWPLVFEQAPEEVDGYIQPTDTNLLTSLLSFSVARFELDEGTENGDPRSISFKMEFAENEYFEDRILEKKFWHRRSRDGYAGLVSEPVPIKWKPNRDLTQGLLGLAVKVAEQERQAAQANGAPTTKKTKPQDWTADQKALRDLIDRYGHGVSFFCWFGFRGQHITAEENAIALEEDKKRRAEKASGTTAIPEKADEEDEEDEEEDDDEYDTLALEIFPDGDDVAVALSEELWPGAIKYFTQSQDNDDDMSDIGFEDNDGDNADGVDDDDDDEAPPLLKRKRV